MRNSLDSQDHRVWEEEEDEGTMEESICNM